MLTLRQTEIFYQHIARDENAARILTVQVAGEFFHATGTVARNKKNAVEFFEMAPSTSCEDRAPVWVCNAEQNVWRTERRDTNQNGTRA